VDLADLVAAVIARLARDRMVQFAVIGAVIFAIAPRPDNAARISLATDYLDALHAAQARKLGVDRLSPEQTAEVDRRAIEDEVLYREALRLGLDRDDAVARRHLVQKMLVLAEDLAGASREPTRAELLTYYEQTRERWHVVERVHFIHVFAASRSEALAIADAVRAAEAQQPGQPPPLGEAFPRSRDVRASRDDLAATYGGEFADASYQLAPGTWSAPIASRFGWHLVKVLDRDAGRPATFDEVADKVRLAYTVVRRHAAIASYIAHAYAHYRVDVDGRRVGDFEPTDRLALRTQPSAED
jgi:peptidyl-prolyl cis-trans isomerase C